VRWQIHSDTYFLLFFVHGHAAAPISFLTPLWSRPRATARGLDHKGVRKEMGAAA